MRNSHTFPSHLRSDEKKSSALLEGQEARCSDGGPSHRVEPATDILSISSLQHLPCPVRLSVHLLPMFPSQVFPITENDD